MGRTKSDSAENFPWDKYFSEDNDLYQSAVETCVSTSTSADLVRKVLTSLGIKNRVGGSKDVNCNKINKEITMIKKKLSKILNREERERKREEVKEFFRQTFLSKAYPKQDIKIPPKPDLPRLTEQEIDEIDKQYPMILPDEKPTSVLGPGPVSRVSSPIRSPMKGNVIIPEIDIFPPTLGGNLKENRKINEIQLLEAIMIMYYKDLPLKDGKKVASKVGAFDYVKNIISDKLVDPTSLLLNQQQVVTTLMNVINTVKASSKKEIPPETIVSAKAIIKDSLNQMISSTPIQEIVLSPEEDIIEISPSEPEIIKETPKIPPPIPSRPIKGKYNKDDFIKVIQQRGWNVPKEDTPEGSQRELLCDYILEQIKEEEPKYKKYEETIQDKIKTLEEQIIGLLQSQESKTSELEKYKKRKKIDEEELLTKEKEIKKLEKKIEQLEKKLLEVKEKEEEVKIKQEDNRQICFAMNDWLNQGEFNESDALASMKCDNPDFPICNLDEKKCSNKSEKYSIDNFEMKITSNNKDVLELISSSLKENRMKEEEKEVKEEEPIQFTMDDLEPYIVGFIKENNIRKVYPEHMTVLINYLEQVFNLDFSGNEDTITEIYRELIEKTKKKSSMKKCNTLEKYSTIEEAKEDLICPEGESCDILGGVCRIAEDDDIVEEVMINDVLIKVIGAENIVNALKEKIKSSIEQKPEQVKEEEPEQIKEEEPEQVKEEEPEQIKEEEPEQVKEEEPEPIKEEPIFKTEKPSLEEIVKGIKSISSGGKSSVTSNQKKLKVAQQKAIERLRKCAGL